MIDVVLKIKDRAWDVVPYVQRWIDIFSEVGDHRIIIWDDRRNDHKPLPAVTKVVKRSDLPNLDEIESIIHRSAIAQTWYEAGIAHLASYYVAETPFFWNIDADDLMFLEQVNPETIQHVEMHAIQSDVLAFSWDISWSYHCRFTLDHPHHWTFGVAFCKRDLIAVMDVLGQKNIGPVPWLNNIDYVFEVAKGKHKIESFVFPNVLRVADEIDHGYDGICVVVGDHKCAPCTDVVVFDDGHFKKSADGFQWLVRQRQHRDMLGVVPDELVVLLNLRQLASKSKTFVDVGAHVGAHTIRVARDYGQVIAIEPDPNNLRGLVANIKANNLTNVFVVESGAGSERRELELHQRGSGSTFGEVADKYGAVQVKVDRLDDLVERADVVKVDTEGWEENVMLGASRLIQQCSPVFVIEHHEYRGYNLPGMLGRICKLLPDYYHIRVDDYHWVHAPKTVPVANLGVAIACGWFMKMTDNLMNGKKWYFGLLQKWWWGMPMFEVLMQIPKHVETEPEWLAVFREV